MTHRPRRSALYLPASNAKAIAKARDQAIAAFDEAGFGPRELVVRVNGIDDDEGFRVEARQAVEFGFDGKTLIHPRQVDLCNAAFELPENAQKASGSIRCTLVTSIRT